MYGGANDLKKRSDRKNHCLMLLKELEGTLLRNIS
jgi:hypothetical protein